MRNKIIILACLFIGLSCNNIDDVFVPVEQDDIAPQKTPTTRGVNNGIYHSLGVGYDITKGYLASRATRWAVVDIDAFLMHSGRPDAYAEDLATRGRQEFYSGANAEEFAKAVRTTTTAGANLTGIASWLPSGNVKHSSDINTQNKYTTKYSYSRADLVKEIKQIKLNATPAMLLPYLRPSFIQDLNLMTPDAFVKEYGTHVLLDITLGGRLQFNYRSQIFETESSTDKKNSVEAGVKVSIAGIGADANGSYTNQTIITQNRKNATWELNVEYVGGAESGKSQQFNSEGHPITTMNYSAWERSVTEVNAEIVDINWEKAYFIYDFVADPAKKAQIKAAVERYVKDETIEIVEVKPLYRLWVKNNNYFTASLSDFHYVQGRWRFVPEYGHTGSYVLGYVFSQQQPGTVPLIRLYSERQDNHILLTSSNEINLYLNSAHLLNNGIAESYIVGYAYPNNRAGTTPIYRVYNNSLRNTFLSTSMDEVRFYQNRWGYFLDPGMTGSNIVGYILP
jgi:hypothetical protein